jgi:hypothetical protein
VTPARTGAVHDAEGEMTLLKFGVMKPEHMFLSEESSPDCFAEFRFELRDAEVGESDCSKLEIVTIEQVKPANHCLDSQCNSGVLEEDEPVSSSTMQSLLKATLALSA